MAGIQSSTSTLENYDIGCYKEYSDMVGSNDSMTRANNGEFIPACIEGGLWRVSRFLCQVFVNQLKNTLFIIDLFKKPFFKGLHMEY